MCTRSCFLLCTAFYFFFFFFSSRSRHTSYIGDWSSDVCSSVLDNFHCLRPRSFCQLACTPASRSEERRVGKECRTWGWAEQLKKKKKNKRGGMIIRHRSDELD